MEPREYLATRSVLVEEGLQEFIHSRYKDELSEMAAYIAVGGKKLRGTMALLMCEAAGGKPEDAVVAACAIELAHSASLQKDDIMDHDDTRRGKPAFWRRFGIELAVLLPDVIIPHAALFTQIYGMRAFLSIIAAWSKIAQGQLLDYPRTPAAVLSIDPNKYEEIIALKTAPLFEVACELGVRAAHRDWLVKAAGFYGHNCGMAFQVVDDACDLLKAVGQPWESIPKGALPVSLRALRNKLGGQPLVTKEDYEKVMTLSETYIQEAQRTSQAFPGEMQSLLYDFPAFCCQALIGEVKAGRS